MLSEAFTREFAYIIISSLTTSVQILILWVLTPRESNNKSDLDGLVKIRDKG